MRIFRTTSPHVLYLTNFSKFPIPFWFFKKIAFYVIIIIYLKQFFSQIFHTRSTTVICIWSNQRINLVWDTILWSPMFPVKTIHILRIYSRDLNAFCKVISLNLLIGVIGGSVEFPCCIRIWIIINSNI